MNGARAVIALYVALALHALAGLVLLLLPGPQGGMGEGAGLGIGLRLEGSDGVFAPPAPSPRPEPATRATVRRATAANAPRRARPPTHAGPDESSAIGEPAAVDPAQSAESQSQAAPARGGGGGTDRYFERLRQHLYRFRRELPGELRAARATIGFTVSPRGELLDLRLVQSSGVSELDAEALDLMRRAVPLPGPPDGAAVQLVVPVEIEP